MDSNVLGVGAVAPPFDPAPAPSPAIRIDKGVPMPAKFTRRGRPTACPYHSMLVGDSFLWPETDGVISKEQRRATASVSGINRRARKSGGTLRFENRTVTEGGKRVIRVWRVS